VPGKAAGTGAAIAQKCIDTANQKLTTAFQAAEANGGCATTVDAAGIDSQLQSFMAAVVTALRPNTTPSKCTALKLSAVGGKVAKALGATAKDRATPDAAKFLKAALSLQAAFVKKFAAAEKKGGCQTTGDTQALDAQADGMIGLAVGELRGLSDVNFANAVSQFTPSPVTLNGQLVSTSGDLTGQLVATYGNGGQATLNFTSALDVSITVGGHTVSLGIASITFALDGTPVNPNDIVAAFQMDIASGNDPSLWSPQGQAILAFSAVLESLTFNADLVVLLNTNGTSGAVSAQVITTGDRNVIRCSAEYNQQLAKGWSSFFTCLKVSAVTSLFGASGADFCGLFLLHQDYYDYLNQCCAAIGCPCVQATDCAAGTSISGGEAVAPDDCSVVDCNFPAVGCPGYPASHGNCRFGPIRDCLPPSTPACCAQSSINSCGGNSCSGSAQGMTVGDCAYSNDFYQGIGELCGPSSPFYGEGARTMLPGDPSCGGWYCCSYLSISANCTENPQLNCNP
jgi:hypothetical protein